MIDHNKKNEVTIDHETRMMHIKHSLPRSVVLGALGYDLDCEISNEDLVRELHGLPSEPEMIEYEIKFSWKQDNEK